MRHCPAVPAHRAWPGAVSLLALLATALPCAALPYKVVGPDGRVTYTDRPPTANAVSAARVTLLGKPAGAPAAASRAGANLPAELRLLAQRYPITLYTTANCAPCDTGRQWLTQRGVPYSERSILTADDEQALATLVGGRSVPSLTIGVQPVRGFAESDWLAYLDAAGYPRESKLPRGWQPPPATPLTEPATRSAEPRPAAAPAPPGVTSPVADVPPPGSLRF